MSPSLQTLLTAPPSGRSRPLLIDGDAYTTRVIRQGAPIPWTDVTALTGHVAQANALLKPDALWVDAGAMYAARVAADPALREAMGARSRTGYALRTLLADAEALEHTRTVLRTLAETNRRGLVLRVPSPARWLAAAHAAAGTALDEVDEDQADSASMYVAEWVGKLGDLPVVMVVLDARGAAGAPGAEAAVPAPTTVPEERLATYTAVANVCAHIDAALALVADDLVETQPGAPSMALVSEGYWVDGGELPEAEVLVARIPTTAVPEQVLAHLGGIR
ncbi:hypothetical protein [Kribbia dieselivorans]|uniref:hypothetical protein n=1 Tax=Kribbia dieselivorans TaxID=331526 RepID=UPI000838037B|nr:hypothetical protein [Kribbia dieselivorans]